MEQQKQLQSPFTLLEIDDTVWSFEAMPGAVDTANAGDSISLRILRVSLGDCIEVRTTGIYLINEHQHRSGSKTTNARTSDVSFFAEQ